MPTFIKQFLIN